MITVIIPVYNSNQTLKECLDAIFSNTQEKSEVIIVSDNSKDNSVDIIICETMASTLEAKCALRAALKANIPVWVSWTLHGDKEDTLPSGESINQAFEGLKGLDADAYLINCCAANLIRPSLKNLKEGNVVLKGESKSISSFDVVESVYATLVAEKDAREKSLKILSDEIFSYNIMIYQYTH